MRHRLSLLPVFTAFCAATLLAQSAPGSAQSRNGNTTWVDIRTWDTEPLYSGWSAEELLDEEAYGKLGEEIGEVEDFIVGPDGRIQQVIVEGGGFLDLGDTHVAVDWSKVNRVGTNSITVPIAEDNLDQYRNVDDVPDKPRSFRVRELIGDYVSADGKNYGTVRDVIFDDNGKINAIIVNPGYGYGYGRRAIALPYYETYYDPYSPYYSVPFGVEALKDLRPFNYAELD